MVTVSQVHLITFCILLPASPFTVSEAGSEVANDGHVTMGYRDCKLDAKRLNRNHVTLGVCDKSPSSSVLLSILKERPCAIEDILNTILIAKYMSPSFNYTLVAYSGNNA